MFMPTTLRFEGINQLRAAVKWADGQAKVLWLPDRGKAPTAADILKVWRAVVFLQCDVTDILSPELPYPLASYTPEEQEAIMTVRSILLAESGS